jgi:hypothetical protein
LVVIFFIFCLAIIAIYYNFKDDESEASGNENAEKSLELASGVSCVDCARRLIDGVYVEKGKENPPLAAVMIDNEVTSRPASGLSKANLVYEAEAEGKITRYLAFFDGTVDLTRVGPIRSARPYFLDWANELSAVYVHCGGSPEALTKIIKYGIADFNEFYNGDYFWRSDEKIAPHNVFTSMQNIQNFIAKKGIRESNYFSWKFKDENKNSIEAKENNINIVFKEPDYIVDWNYDSENNSYIRSLAGKIQTDDGDNKIVAKNIIVQVNKTEIIDSKFRLDMKTTGSGKAIVCLDGFCEEGEWQKENYSSRTRYFDSAGKEFEFNPGVTWIEVVRSVENIKY